MSLVKQGPLTARKRPVDVEVWPWNGTASDATPIINWILENGGTARYDSYAPEWESEDGKQGHPEILEGIYIHTLEGTMRAKATDVIIRGVEGEFYACDRAVFDKTYEIILHRIERVKEA